MGDPADCGALCGTEGKGRKRKGMLLVCMCMLELMTHTGVGELSWAVYILYLASTSIYVLCFDLGATACRADAAIFLISLACLRRILSPLLSCFIAHCSTLCYLHHHHKLSVRIADRAGVEVQDDSGEPVKTLTRTISTMLLRYTLSLSILDDTVIWVKHYSLTTLY